jgi:hypothetical protein
MAANSWVKTERKSLESIATPVLSPSPAASSHMRTSSLSKKIASSWQTWGAHRLLSARVRWLSEFQRKHQKNPPPPDGPGNPTVKFHGEKRSSQIHESKTDPDAKLARNGNGKEAKLSHNGNMLMENRKGIILNTEAFEAHGTRERDAALVTLEQIPGPNLRWQFSPHRSRGYMFLNAPNRGV